MKYTFATGNRVSGWGIDKIEIVVIASGEEKALVKAKEIRKCDYYELIKIEE